MFDKLKVSFFISAFLGGSVILNSAEARQLISMNDKHEMTAHTSVRPKQLLNPIQKKLSPDEIVGIMSQQLLGRTTAESEDTIAAQIQEICSKASSPTLEQVKEIRALNCAFDEAIQKFIHERNKHRICSRQKVSKQSFTRRPVSLKKIDSRDRKRTHGTIRKTTRKTREFARHQEHW
ncbi:MAG: hypothetical protein JNJ47_06275, partial [Alphaproteobacteria bacterium]|nr:hypothetical protein [Alphaproteobacteria bacterium]